MIKIEQLYYLTEVAKNNSIHKTAEKLYMTSAAISTSIKQMEKECGYEILERTYRGVKLTEKGRKAEKLAQQILALQNRILDLGKEESSNLPEYELVIDKQCFKLLAQKVIAPGSKFFSTFKIREVRDAHSEYLAYLVDNTVLVMLVNDEQKKSLENDNRLKMQVLYESYFYPVSSRATKWIKPNLEKISKNEFAVLPKIQMGSEFSTDEENVVLSTDDAAIYAEAIINDYGVGIITKFAPNISSFNHDDFKIYEPFEDKSYIVALVNARNNLNTIELFEKLIKE